MKPLRAGIVLLAAVLSIPVHAQSEQDKAEFITLGTGGGPITRLKRSQPANAVVVGTSVYLFDTGDGVQRQLRAAGYDVRQVKAVFLSHHHIDHTSGLAPMLASRWLLNMLPPLPVFGPPGTREMIDGLSGLVRPAERAPITIGGPPKPPFATSVAPKELAADLDAPALIYRDENVRVYAVTNDHFHFTPGSPEALTSRSYAFRIEAAGRRIIYTGDTGPSAKLEQLAKDADLLVSEVIDLAGIRRELDAVPWMDERTREGAMAHMVEDHLTPEQVGALATISGVGRVVLTHLVPGADSETSTASYADGVRARFKGPVTVAADLSRF